MCNRWLVAPLHQREMLVGAALSRGRKLRRSRSDWFTDRLSDSLTKRLTERSEIDSSQEC
jgi:hypothetical protein